MHAQLHTLDIHVQAAQQRRYQDAILNEQLRLTRQNRQNRLMAALNTIRISLGTMLMATGQRLAHEEETLRDARREARPTSA